jgi:hypothetical protein
MPEVSLLGSLSVDFQNNWIFGAGFTLAPFLFFV